MIIYALVDGRPEYITGLMEHVSLAHTLAKTIQSVFQVPVFIGELPSDSGGPWLWTYQAWSAKKWPPLQVRTNDKPAEAVP